MAKLGPKKPSDTKTPVKKRSPKKRKEANASSEQDAMGLNLDYWKNYRLQRDPFEPPLDENERLSIPLPDTQTNVDLVNHLLHFNNVLICMSGPKGIGKTSFLRELLSQLDTSIVFPHHTLGGPKLTPEQLVSLLNYAFEVAIPEANTPAQQLETQVETLQFLDQQSLLIIDDAHLLPADTIAALFELIAQQSDDQMNFHVLLLGDNELMPLIKKHVSNDDDLAELYHHIELEPLNQSNTENYLKEYFLAAGLQGDFPLTHQQISKIWSASQGVPARINNVAKQVMMNSGSSGNPSSSLFASIWKENKKTIIGGIIILIALVVVSIFTTFTESKPDDITPVPNVKQQTAEPIPTEIETENIVTKAKLPAIHLGHTTKKIQSKSSIPAFRQKNNPSGQENTQTISKQLPIPPIDDNESSVSSSKTSNPLANSSTQENHALTPKMKKSFKLTEQKNSQYVTHSQEQQTAFKDNIDILQMENQQVLTNTSGPHTKNLVANDKLVHAIKQNRKDLENGLQVKTNKNIKPQIKSPTLTTEKKAATPTLTTTMPQTQIPSMSTTQKPKTTTTEKIKPKQASKIKNQTTLSQDEKALLKMPRSRYTIQLMAAINPVNLRKLHNKGIRTRIYEFRAERRGKRWHIAVTGTYRSRAGARAAIRRLPFAVRRYKPWIKSYRDIHKEIRNR